MVDHDYPSLTCLMAVDVVCSFWETSLQADYVSSSRSGKKSASALTTRLFLERKTVWELQWACI